MMTAEVEVEAKSLKAAIKEVEENDALLDLSCDGSYLDYSFEVNEDVTTELNNT